jgi:hypothetical protein
MPPFEIGRMSTDSCTAGTAGLLWCVKALPADDRNPFRFGSATSSAPAGLRVLCLILCCLRCLAPLLQLLDLGSITKRHIRTAACSAHSGDGLLHAFEWLVKDISSRIYLFRQ